MIGQKAGGSHDAHVFDPFAGREPNMFGFYPTKEGPRDAQGNPVNARKLINKWIEKKAQRFSELEMGELLKRAEAGNLGAYGSHALTRSIEIRKERREEEREEEERARKDKLRRSTIDSFVRGGHSANIRTGGLLSSDMNPFGG